MSESKLTLNVESSSKPNVVIAGGFNMSINKLEGVQAKFCRKMALRTTAARLSSMKQWAYNLSGFNKYGLMRDDCLYENDDVKEALRRIPDNVVDERNFRLVRAIQLSLQKTILPKEEWTKLEDDVLYLTPVVKQVEKERKEKEAWEANY